jgi:hypothetical protein
MMQDIASGMGFNVMAGDTDSPFLDGGDGSGDMIQQFVAECNGR